MDCPITLFELTWIQFVPSKTIICPHSDLPGYKSRSCGRLECAFFVCDDINLLDRKWRERILPSMSAPSTWREYSCIVYEAHCSTWTLNLSGLNCLMTSNPQWVVVVANQWLVAALDLITNSLQDISYPNRVAVWISILKYVCHVDWF